MYQVLLKFLTMTATQVEPNVSCVLMAQVHFFSNQSLLLFLLISDYVSL